VTMTIVSTFILVDGVFCICSDHSDIFTDLRLAPLLSVSVEVACLTASTGH
jgi:hypothetical protein